VRGCAPKTENIKAAMNEDIKTSATPYFPVVSISSNEKAMPGRTLHNGDVQISGLILNLRRTDFAKKIRAVAGTTL